MGASSPTRAGECVSGRQGGERVGHTGSNVTVRNCLLKTRSWLTDSGIQGSVREQSLTC